MAATVSAATPLAIRTPRGGGTDSARRERACGASLQPTAEGEVSTGRALTPLRVPSYNAFPVFEGRSREMRIRRRRARWAQAAPRGPRSGGIRAALVAETTSALRAPQARTG